ncbi:EamA family transporter [Massilia sp. GCM10023247]|uniref:EamA family transporter n=1 Tax=Massilia sp. GCM10023247 TaxID=3252643 RepID=UPI00360808CC
MSTIPSWIPFALGSAFFAALTAFFGKLGVAGVNSNMATLIRTAVIAAVTLSIVLSRSEWQPLGSIPQRSWLWLVLSGVVSGLSWLCYYRALQLGPISVVAPVDKLSVAIAILLGVFILGEALTWQVATGAGLIILGTIVIIAF